jgi:hypothetical protein
LNIWFNLHLQGLCAEDLARLHGFLPGTQLRWTGSARVDVDRVDGVDVDGPEASVETSFELSSATMRALLRPDRAATLQQLSSTPISLMSERSSFLPLFAALTQQWLRIGRLPVHGAVLRLGKRCVLVLGESHSGKSTLTTRALSEKTPVVSDDYVLLSNASTLQAERLRGFLRVRTDSGEQCYTIPQAHELFPQQLQIDSVLLLQTGARAAQSSFFGVSALQVMSEFIQQSAPYFMRPAFVVERANLTAFAKSVSRLPAIGAIGGFDILEDFSGFLARTEAAFAAR